MTEKGMYLCSF